MTTLFVVIKLKSVVLVISEQNKIDLSNVLTAEYSLQQNKIFLICNNRNKHQKAIRKSDFSIFFTGGQYYF